MRKTAFGRNEVHVGRWNYTDLTGKRFGRLQVISRNGKIGADPAWVCFCDCGTWKKVRGVSLRKGDTSSCGCLRLEESGNRARTHGRRHTPEYAAWAEAKKRCFNPNTWNYADYGGRGISMCQEWRDSFEEFFKYMGAKPTNRHSIDRWPNRDGHYEPGNCRWATKKQQSDNRDYTIMCSFNGKSMPLMEWAAELGIPYKCLHRRLKYLNWSVEDAFTKPKRQLRRGGA